MGSEDRYDAMSDYSAEKSAEGRAEVVSEIYEHFKNATKQTWSTEEILEVISSFDG